VQSIVAPLETTVQSRTGDDVTQVADVDQQEIAEAAYQLSQAYDIGFGVPISQQSVLDNLLLSCILGHVEARQEVYAIYTAYGVALPLQHKEMIERWLYEAALAGDKVSADHLRELSRTSYYDLQERNDRRRKLCERSGLIFDDDFWTTNDISDAEGLAAAILDSGDRIDVDIGGGMTWLHVAAYGGSLQLASILVDELGHPLDNVNNRGQTPLWIACLGGRRDIAVFLLGRGADASLASYAGLTALHHLPAFDDSDVAIVASMLVSNQADVNSRGPEDMTPLHYAIRGSGLSDSEPAVATLLHLGADPLLEDSDGETPLDAAIFLMRTHFVQQIMESEIIRRLGREGQCKVLASAFKNFVGQLKRHRLCQGSSKYQERLMFLISLLCENDIIEKYISEDELGSSPLHDCYIHHSLDIAAAMLQIGVPDLLNMRTIKGHGVTPLLAAVSRAVPRLELEKLVNAGADYLIPARTGANIIHYCVEYHADLINWVCSLIEKQAGSAILIDMLNGGTEKQGWTPLDYAMILRDGKTATLLQRLGAQEAKCKYMRQEPPHWNEVLDQLHSSLNHSQHK
jgi:ankyrin repeat protein